MIKMIPTKWNSRKNMSTKVNFKKKRNIMFLKDARTMKPPFVLFLGDVQDPLAAKSATGLLYWRSEDCIGQVRMPDCGVPIELPDVDLTETVRLGAKTFVIGVTNSGGKLNPCWHPYILEAINYGLDIASGLHDRLTDVPEFVAAANRTGVRLLDLRHTDTLIPKATGLKRQGQRLLTLGTDCACGKKFTTLAITRDMKARGINCTFRATGQTGIMISGEGFALDTIIGDYIAGAAELLSPGNKPNHWDVIEGQGSILHPSHAGVPLSLLHGSQPDAFVLCHEPTRLHMLGTTYPIPSIAAVREATEYMGRLTNPNIRCVGVSLNTSKFQGDISQLKQQLSKEHGVPVVDPVIDGTNEIIDYMQSIGLLE
jgi:uncharacterized NAD-dependent epimerase/dehydratase family protein